MNAAMEEADRGQVELAEGPLLNRYRINQNYVTGLSNDNLLRSFYLEAGLWSYSGNGGTTTASTTSMDGPERWHWGWESVTCELRGHFMGHWLSAAAHIYAQTKDAIVKAKAETIVSELARCQEANGGEWLAAFPQTFMHRLEKGQWVWAPHYTIHKLLMGLLDMYRLVGSEQAMRILKGMARWFHRWTSGFSTQQMEELLDMETGGMLEAWADLYAMTGERSHEQLMLRYVRRKLFDRLLAGEDVLTNRHANTQIPEVLGAARVFEVTGERYYRQAVEAFWKCAVVDRGYVSTGAADDGELWMPPDGMAQRLGNGQEHCCNYNMMRLAHKLLCWTGDAAYADYWERRFVNGVLAHQHGETGMVSYFIGVGPGSRKVWGSETGHFWCCHGTLIQANAAYDPQIFLKTGDGVAIAQWMPSKASFKLERGQAAIEITQDGQHGIHPLGKWSVAGMRAITEVDKGAIPISRPDRFVYRVTVTMDSASSFTLRLRLPWWVNGRAEIAVNGVGQTDVPRGGCFYKLSRVWHSGDSITVELPTKLVAEPLPGSPELVSFVDGPVVLAGLTEEDRLLYGDAARPATLLAPDRERNHSWWNNGYYRSRNLEGALRFIPLHEVKDEAYSVYFRLADLPHNR